MLPTIPNSSLHSALSSPRTKELHEHNQLPNSSPLAKVGTSSIVKQHHRKKKSKLERMVAGNPFDHPFVYAHPPPYRLHVAHAPQDIHRYQAPILTERLHSSVPLHMPFSPLWPHQCVSPSLQEAPTSRSTANFRFLEFNRLLTQNAYDTHRPPQTAQRSRPACEYRFPHPSVMHYVPPWTSRRENFTPSTSLIRFQPASGSFTDELSLVPMQTPSSLRHLWTMATEQSYRIPNHTLSKRLDPKATAIIPPVARESLTHEKPIGRKRTRHNSYRADHRRRTQRRRITKHRNRSIVKKFLVRKRQRQRKRQPLQSVAPDAKLDTSVPEIIPSSLTIRFDANQRLASIFLSYQRRHHQPEDPVRCPPRVSNSFDNKLSLLLEAADFIERTHDASPGMRPLDQ